MITVTQSASAQMKKILSDEPHGHYVRAYISGECCSGFNYGFTIAESLEEDDWSEGDLVVDPTSMRYFNGAEIDYTTDKLKGKNHFVIINTKSQCHFDLWMRQ